MAQQPASIKGTSVSINATTSNGNVPLPAGATDATTIIVTNDGPNTGLVTTGVGNSTTATTSNFPVPVGQYTMSKPIGDNYAAAICASGSALIYFTFADGL